MHVGYYRKLVKGKGIARSRRNYKECASMRIQNNVTAQNSHRQYGLNVENTSKNMEKLSSGFRVNRAADDAAGLAISEKMRTQIRGLSMASRNTQDGISLLQVADGAMQASQSIIQRMRELAIQSANGTNESLDRNALDLEYQQLKWELDDIADRTNFNGVYPLKGFAARNPKSGSLTGTGISSSQIAAINMSVPNTAGPAQLPSDIGTVSGTSPTQRLTITTPGNYRINSGDLAGFTNFNLGAGVTLVIDSIAPNQLSTPLDFGGQGQARINGNVIGTGEIEVGFGNTVQITGSIAGKVYNDGKMIIGGPDTAAVTFGGGDIHNYGQMLITNNGARILNNTGNMHIAGSGSTFPSGSLGNNGNLRYEPMPPVTAATITATINTTGNGAKGRIEVAANATITNMAANDGMIFVEDNGTANGISYNRGVLEVSANGVGGVSTNTSDGKIFALGSIRVIVANAGYIEVGKWDGDDSTPAAGSTTRIPQTIANNTGGTIRNFSAQLTVTDCSAGAIDNYGTINFVNAPTGSTIRHHARGLDATFVNNNKDAEQTLYYTVNGAGQSLKTGWQQVAGGYELVFDAPAVDGYDVIFTSWSTAKVPGMNYGIQNIVNIPGVSGTSGTSLAYFMEDPFILQTGANQGDQTYLSFRALDAMNLGAEADKPSEKFECLGETHILDMESAQNSITVALNAINDISTYRAELGAQYNRLEYKYDNLGVSTENLGAAESRIRDADMAKQMTHFTKNNILIQSSTAMLAQANSLPQGVLQLLG